MIARNPAAVPFVILLLLAVGLVRIVPGAMLTGTTAWAIYLIVVTLGGLAILWLITRGNRKILRDVSVAAMWLLAALILAKHQNGLAFLCLIPLCFALRHYLPKAPPPRGHAFQSAVLLQAGFALSLAGKTILALIPGTLGVLLILWAKEQSEKQWRFRLFSAAVAVAVVLFLMRPPPLLYPSSASAGSKPAPEDTNRVQGGRSNSAYLGLIFRPDLKSEEKKLPPPPDLKIRAFRQVFAEPVEIPFRGVYWMFQRPLIRPPENAPVIRGTPAAQKYSSDDGRTPLRFEAHQTFGQTYPMRRLSSIAVKLENSDTYHPSLTMELIAGNSNVPHDRQSFGRKPIEP
ncbi:MAG: hypothetical protein FJW36_02970 [Acidobacteria bacterium]|nr:hypothetical protein [Acidobacteriota bacterium]